MDNSVNIAARASAPQTVPAATSPPSEAKSAAGGLDFFWNLLDIINPLQHIPVVSTIYRAITGDEISPAAKLIGGTLFGGPIGAVAAIAGIAIEETTGREVGEYLIAAITGNDDTAPAAGLQQAQILQVQRQPRRQTIIWNGLRQLPTPRSPALSSLQPTPEPSRQPALTANQPEPSAAVTATLASAPPRPAAPATSVVVAASAGAAATAPRDSAAWLTTALAQAQILQTAQAVGDTSVRPEPQPWIADAMMQALDQYDALARQRQRQTRSDTDP